LRIEVVGSVSSSIVHLKNALRRESLDSVLSSIWFAMSDMEYVAFMASMMLKDKPDNLVKERMKVNDEAAAYGVIASAIETLERLKKEAESMSLDNVYKDAVAVHSYLLKVMDFLEKKRARGKSTTPA